MTIGLQTLQQYIKLIAPGFEVLDMIPGCEFSLGGINIMHGACMYD